MVHTRMTPVSDTSDDHVQRQSRRAKGKRFYMSLIVGLLVLGVVMAVLGFYFVTRWQSLPDQSMHPSSPRLGPSLTMALIGCALCLVAIFAWLVLAEKCICINLFSRKGNSRPDTEYMPMNSVTNPQAELILQNGGFK